MPSGKFTNYKPGDVVGHLTLISVYVRDGAARAVCSCSLCGNSAYDTGVGEAKKRQKRLQKAHPGELVSCGCQRLRLLATSHTLPDAKSYKKSYHVWRMMVKRCCDETHQAYYNYGARGITVCERWMTYENFVADMGEPPTKHDLERKDNSLGYSAENCGWRTRRRNSNNRRSSKHVVIGKTTYTYSQAARKFGFSPSTIAYRDKAGVVGHDLLLPRNDVSLLPQARMFTVGNEVKHVAGWAREWGVTHHVARTRLKNLASQGAAHDHSRQTCV